MKKLLVIFVVLALLLTITVPAMAKKPDAPPGQVKKVEKIKVEKEERVQEQKEKENGAVFYEFFLSGEVMPVPPYGGSDVEGSDEKSKLIVNQPNGENVANVTGVMKGLLPDTEYTVYFSNGYVPYSTLEINLVGEYTLDYYIVDENGAKYPHTLVITEQFEDGTFVGTGIGLNDGKLETITGTLNGYDMTIHSEYLDAEGQPVADPYYYDAVLLIAEDGTMAGTWVDKNSTAGVVMSSDGIVEVHPEEGNTSWSGLLSDLIPPFTFMTSEDGHASWHVNIPCEAFICEEGMAEFSVWINGSGGTVLISETVVLECDCESEPEVIEATE